MIYLSHNDTDQRPRVSSVRCNRWVGQHLKASSRYSMDLSKTLVDNDIDDREERWPRTSSKSSPCRSEIAEHPRLMRTLAALVRLL